MNKRLLNIAKQLKPELIHTYLNKDFCDELKAGQPFVIDFSSHYTGFLSLDLDFEGSPVDAPILLKIKFCEHKDELNENSEEYHGWISKSWIQEELIHLDTLPALLKFKRRYAFRYVKIELIASSNKYKVVLKGAHMDAVSSNSVKVNYVGNNSLEKNIDKVALLTLHECMQYEFEDGPKRDRRLWLGDLRLQALTNYYTYKNYDLVKRCLYLFAGVADKDGRVPACVFTSPKVVGDDTFMFDYSLLYVSTLNDYYKHTNDLKTVIDLLPIATRQIELAQNNFTNDIVNDSDVLGWCFLDWNLRLNKQCGAQGVYLVALKDLIELYKATGKDAKLLIEDQKRKLEASKHFYDEKLGVYVSGKDRQISLASNVWMILGNDFSKEKNQQIINNLKSLSPEEIVTPYMYHYYIEALIKCGLLEDARLTMDEYWGAMVNDGADTFYELFNPKNKDESPYGGKAVLSYCHAWSCTPSYLLRKYFIGDNKND